MKIKLHLALLSVFCACLFAKAQPGFTCAEAVPIGSLPYNTTDDTANYGNTINTSPGNSCGFNTSQYLFGNDVFYSYTATSSGFIKITMTPTIEKTAILVYDGCSDVGLNCVAAVANPTLSPRIIPQLEVTAGHTYIFLISKETFPTTAGYSLAIENLNCFYPTELSITQVGTTTADLTWNNPAGVGNFEVLVQPASASMPTGSGVPVSGMTFTATNLDPGTSYLFWVRTVCGDGTFSLWSPNQSFLTDIANSQCPLANQCNYTLRLGDSFGDSWNNNSVTVRQNGIDVATLTLDGFSDFSQYDFTVPLCDNQPFELFWNAGGQFPSEVSVKIINQFGQTIYEKPTGVGAQNTLLFQATANCSAPICPTPANVHFTDLAAGAASVAWTELGTATLWEVVVLPAGSPAPTASDSGVETSLNPFTIATLIDGATYDFYVRAICADNFKSEWTFAATATATCPAPQNIQLVQTPTATVLYWAPGLASQWQVFVQAAGLPAPDSNATGLIVDTPQFVLDSTVEGSFDVYIRANCSTSDSVWSPPFQFEVTCAQVTDVNVTGNIVSWTANGSANDWEIWVQPGNVSYPGGSVYELYTTSANPFVIPDIVVGQTYSVFVRSVCTAGDSGIWSTQKLFVYSGPLANPEFPAENFFLYPNPAEDAVIISAPENAIPVSIRFIDLLGKTVKMVNEPSHQTAVDVSAFPIGVYVVEIKLANGTKQIKKLVTK